MSGTACLLVRRFTRHASFFPSLLPLLEPTYLRSSPCVSCLVSSFLPSHPALLPTCVGQVRAPLSLSDCSLLSFLRKYRPWLPQYLASLVWVFHRLSEILDPLPVPVCPLPSTPSWTISTNPTCDSRLPRHMQTPLAPLLPLSVLFFAFDTCRVFPHHFLLSS